jgi:hypothetical protein
MMNPFVSAVVLITLSAGPTLEAEEKVPLPNIAEPTAGWNFGILIDRALHLRHGRRRYHGQGPDTFEAKGQG